jgi:hypothetical protein
LIKTYTTTKELRDGISVCIGKMGAGGVIPDPNPGQSVPGGGQPVTVRATYTFNFFPVPKLLKFNLLKIRLVATQSERSEVVTPSYTAGAQQGPNAPNANDACSP